MHKRLIVLLALAFVVGLAMSAYAEVQNVKVSGDLTTYGIARSNFGLNKDAGQKRERSILGIVGVKVDADLTDNVMTTVKLISEDRWGPQNDTATSTDVDIELAYVTLKEFLYSPLTISVGRQELHYGNDMIIGAVGTNRTAPASSILNGTHDAALSPRHAFDAIRAVLNYDPLVIDVIYSNIREGVVTVADDQTLYGLNAHYKVSSDTSAEGYFFSKFTDKYGTTGATNAETDATYVLGGRIGGVKNKENVDLGANLEAAYQFGKYNDGTRVSDRRAWAAEAALTAGMKNVKYTPAFTALAAYFSGKKAPGVTTEESKTYRGWDPMFENQKFGDIANSQFAQTNARLVGGIADLKLTEDVSLKGELYFFWWDMPFVDGGTITNGVDTFKMTGKRYAGSEVDLTATYNYTEDVQFGLLGGIFVPGRSFDNANNNAATELIGSMKVTF